MPVLEEADHPVDGLGGLLVVGRLSDRLQELLLVGHPIVAAGPRFEGQVQVVLLNDARTAGRHSDSKEQCRTQGQDQGRAQAGTDGRKTPAGLRSMRYSWVSRVSHPSGSRGMTAPCLRD